MIPVQTQNQPMMMAIQPSFQTNGNSTFSNIVQVPNQMISIPNQTNSYQINTNMGPFQMVPVIQPPQHVLSSSSEEAVLCQTSSSIRCANMICFAFILWVSIVTSINLTITDKSSKKSEFLLCEGQSVYPVLVGWGGGQVELFNDLVLTVVRGAVSVVRSWEVISF